MYMTYEIAAEKITNYLVFNGYPTVDDLEVSASTYGVILELQANVTELSDPLNIITHFCNDGDYYSVVFDEEKVLRSLYGDSYNGYCCHNTNLEIYLEGLYGKKN